MKDESSMEFDMLEEVRRRLTRAFEGRGHDPLEAERAALYVVQGLREAHRLIAAITREGKSDEVVLSILDKVLENAPAFVKARAVLAGQDEDKTLH